MKRADYKYMKRLFKKDIEQSCEYCANSIDKANVGTFCTKLRRSERPKKCKYFKYDPLKRVPVSYKSIPDYDPQEFSI